MCLPRARFTLRSMMVFVAVVALGLAVVEEFQDGLPPRFVLRDIPRRIARLRPGMTSEQAHEILGLERTWLLGGIGARWKCTVGNRGIDTEHYSVGGVSIFLGIYGRHTTKLGLIGVTVLRGPATIAEMHFNR